MRHNSEPNETFIMVVFILVTLVAPIVGGIGMGEIASRDLAEIGCQEASKPLDSFPGYRLPATRSPLPGSQATR